MVSTASLVAGGVLTALVTFCRGRRRWSSFWGLLRGSEVAWEASWRSDKCSGADVEALRWQRRSVGLSGGCREGGWEEVWSDRRGPERGGLCSQTSGGAQRKL